MIRALLVYLFTPPISCFAGCSCTDTSVRPAALKSFRCNLLVSMYKQQSHTSSVRKPCDSRARQRPLMSRFRKYGKRIKRALMFSLNVFVYILDPSLQTFRAQTDCIHYAYIYIHTHTHRISVADTLVDWMCLCSFK